MTDSERARYLGEKLLAEMRDVPRRERSAHLRGWYSAIRTAESKEVADHAFLWIQMLESAMPQKVVITLHGINTSGKWQKEITADLSREGFVHEPLDYGYFFPVLFLIPFFRSKKVEWFRDQYLAVCDRNQTKRPSIVAHSFGTYVVAKAIEKYNFEFDQVVFCGAIVRREFAWSRFATLVNRVLNDYGGADRWARIVVWAVNDAGQSGLIGFTDSWSGLTQRNHPDFGHSDYFYSHNYRTSWIPFLQGGDPAPLFVNDVRRPNWKFLATVSVAGAVILLWLAYKFVWPLI